MPTIRQTSSVPSAIPTPPSRSTDCRSSCSGTSDALRAHRPCPDPLGSGSPSRSDARTSHQMSNPTIGLEIVAGLGRMAKESPDNQPGLVREGNLIRRSRWNLAGNGCPSVQVPSRQHHKNARLPVTGIRLFRLAEFVADTHAPPIADGGILHLRNPSPEQAKSLPRSVKLGRVSDQEFAALCRFRPGVLACRGRLFRQPRGQAASHTANRTVPGSTPVTVRCGSLWMLVHGET